MLVGTSELSTFRGFESEFTLINIAQWNRFPWEKHMAYSTMRTRRGFAGSNIAEAARHLRSDYNVQLDIISLLLCTTEIRLAVLLSSTHSTFWSDSSCSTLNLTCSDVFSMIEEWLNDLSLLHISSSTAFHGIWLAFLNSSQFPQGWARLGVDCWPRLQHSDQQLRSCTKLGAGFEYLLGVGSSWYCTSG